MKTPQAQGRANKRKGPPTVIDSIRQVVRCEACGGEWPLQLPMSVNAFSVWCKAFDVEHKRCVKR